MATFWSILRHPDIAQLKRTKRLGGFGVFSAGCGGVFGKWVERPILPEKSRYDHVILAVVLSMARQEEVKRSRMLAEALGNIILIDTKWNASK